MQRQWHLCYFASIKELSVDEMLHRNTTVINSDFLQCNNPWWRHCIEIRLALPTLCKWNPPVTCGILSRKASNIQLWSSLHDVNVTSLKCEMFNGCAYMKQVRKGPLYISCIRHPYFFALNWNMTILLRSWINHILMEWWPSSVTHI